MFNIYGAVRVLVFDVNSSTVTLTSESARAGPSQRQVAVTARVDDSEPKHRPLRQFSAAEGARRSQRPI